MNHLILTWEVNFSVIFVSLWKPMVSCCIARHLKRRGTMDLFSSTAESGKRLAEKQ